MFGYVKPYKPDMRIREFDLYQAVYCGLCKQLGRLFGPFARLTLSYDFTFLAAVSLALSPECPGFEKSACAANPLKKKTCLVPCTDLSYAASAAMVLFYYKVKDNIADEGMIKRIGYRLLLPLAAGARKKAAKLYPFLEQTVADSMKEQANAESAQDTSVDRAADPTAKMLGGIFAGLLPEDTLQNDPQKRVLYRMGYQLGRWIYLMDALDDIRQDVSRKGFNPIARKLSITAWSKEEQKRANEYGLQVLNLSVTEMASAYELLDIRRYQEIINNVIYLGLKQTQAQLMEQSLLTKKEKKARRKAMKKQAGLPIEQTTNQSA